MDGFQKARTSFVETTGSSGNARVVGTPSEPDDLFQRNASPPAVNNLPTNKRGSNDDDDHAIMSQKQGIANRSGGRLASKAVQAGAVSSVTTSEEQTTMEQDGNHGEASQALSSKHDFAGMKGDAGDDASNQLNNSGNTEMERVHIRHVELQTVEPFHDEMFIDGDGVDEEDNADKDLEQPDESGFLVEATLVEDAGEHNMTEAERAQFEDDTRKRVMQEMMVDAEAAVLVEDFDDPIKARQRRRRNLCLCLLAVLLLVAVILGSVLGTASSRSGSSTLVIITPAPTISSAPSVQPSLFPTTSPAPSASPSASPSSKPSASPTSSPQPSALPSPSPSKLPTSSPSEAPDNNYCEDALLISIGESVFIENLWAVDTFIPTPPDDWTISPSPPDDETSAAPPTSSPENESPTNSPQNANEGTWIPTMPENATGQTSNIFLPQQKKYTDDAVGQEVVMQIIIDCEFGGAYSAPGRWYKLQGAGPVTLSTCDERTTATPTIQGKPEAWLHNIPWSVYLHDFRPYAPPPLYSQFSPILTVVPEVRGNAPVVWNTVEAEVVSTSRLPVSRVQSI